MKSRTAARIAWILLAAFDALAAAGMVLVSLNRSVADIAENAAFAAIFTFINGELAVTVRDDGRGFDPATPLGAGLTNMSARLAALGGALEVTSAPGEGTTVTGRIPVSEPTPLPSPESS